MQPAETSYINSCIMSHIEVRMTYTPNVCLCDDILKELHPHSTPSERQQTRLNCKL